MNNQQTAGINFQALINKVKDLLLTPDAAWEKIRSDNESISSIYKNYILILAAISPLFSWIKFSLIGTSALGYTYRAPIVGGLISSILQYLVQLAMVYIAALILEKLAPKFEGSTDINRTFRLVAYAATPAYISGLFIIIPAIGVLAGLAGFVYSVFLFFKGLPKFIEINEAKKIAYIAVSVVCIIISGLLLNLIIMAVAPMQAAGNIYRGDTNVDLNELEDKARQIQNMFQKP